MPPSLSAHELVKQSSRGSVLGTGSSNLGLRIQTCCLCLGVGATDVGQLVADAVGDDVRVQGVLLALGDQRVRWQEGALGGLPAGATELEVDGWRALAEVGCPLFDGGGGYGGGGREEGKEDSLGVHFWWFVR